MKAANGIHQTIFEKWKNREVNGNTMEGGAWSI
jgi:hypothetical protein